MKLQRIGLTALFAIVATLSVGDWGLILRSQVKTSMGAALAQTTDERKVEAHRLLEQGRQQYQNQQYEAALQSYQQVLAIYREIKDRRREGYALGLVGAIYIDLKDLPRAIEYLQQSLVIARSINDRELETLAQQVLSLAQIQSHPRKVEADRLFQQGIEQNQSSQFEAAIQFWQQALAIYQEIQDGPSEGIVLGNIGNAYQNLGDYGKAIDYYQQRVAITKEIQDRQSEGGALGDLGVVYLYLGDYGKAIDYLHQWLAIAKEMKDRQGEGRALGNLGTAYLYLGDYGKAIDYLPQQLAIAREIQDRPSEGAALGNMGAVYRNLGDYGKAIDYFQQVLAIAREIQDRNSQIKALGNIGGAYLHLGDYGKAIDYSQQSLEIAREIQDREGEEAALGDLGIAYQNLGDYGKATDYLQQQLAIVREIQNRRSEGIALNNLGAALFRQGNLTAAETTLIQAIEVFESLRGGLKDSEKVSIIDTQSLSYRTLQQVLIAQNKTDTALEISERSRARAFVELLAQRLSPNSQQPLPATFLKPTISQLKQIASTQKATLVQYSIIYNEFKVQGKERTKESELYIWVIQPTGEVTFRKADLKPLWQQQNTSLAELVFTSRDSIGVRSNPIVGIVSRQPGQKPPDSNQQLQQLHQILIEPIADLLPTDPNAKVTFIPQSSLFLVPFPALKDKAGKYLIEKHTILTAPSIQVLELTHQQRRAAAERHKSEGEVLIVGNPTMPSVRPAFDQPPQPLAPLPGAEREAQVIAPLFNTQPLIGNAATKAAILQQLPQAKIVHFATHGIFDDIRGLGSAIALAPSGNDDGLLTAEEILDLKLSAELVVLSACNTGRGRISGDGVVGLSRSLISAGVPSVIVSLWSVPDSPTAFLMGEFYQNLQKNPNKAQALRQAMLTTMKQHPEPKDWAAFTLIGEAE